jgi:hypothetical protein
MQYLVYLSQAVRPLGDEQLLDLLMQARGFNEAHALTGILLYGNQHFMQVLEGEAATVHALYARICRDPRHRNVHLYRDQACAQRRFAQRHMAFHPTAPQQVLEYATYMRPESLSLDHASLSPADAQLLSVLQLLVLT